MNDIYLKGNLPVSDQVYKSPEIKQYLINNYMDKNRNITMNLPLIFSSTIQLKEIIDPQKIYIAEFPKTILEQINSGNYDFMRTKAGDILATIIDKNAPTNKNIVHNLRLQEINPNFSQSIQNISLNLAAMAILVQLANINAEMVEIKKAIMGIGRGQINDRIALVNAGRDQIKYALHIENVSNRNCAFINAMQTLSEARNKLESFLKDIVNNINHIPSNKFLIMWKSLSNRQFFQNCQTDYLDFQENFYAYIDASILLAMVFNEIDEKESLQEVFNPVKGLIEYSANNIKRLSSIACKGNPDPFLWYEKPSNIIKAIDNYYNKALPSTTGNIQMEIPGSVLIYSE